jgi:hypothetical protein
MRLKVLSTLAAALFAFSTGLAAQQPSGKIGINRMFVDAHSPDQPTYYSHSEIKKMIRDARTPEDFNRLADYFDYRAMEFEKKTQEQLKELQRLLGLPYHAKSYPAQVDYARELLKSYRNEAQNCDKRADTYRELASGNSETK